MFRLILLLDWPAVRTRHVQLPRRALALLLVPLLLAGAVAAQDEDTRLETLLGRLGLAELQMRHLEQSVAAKTGAAQHAAARKLGDLYAEQLAAALENPERYAELKQRVEQLIARVPEANTASLEVALLQTDYQRAESLIARAMLEADSEKLLSEAEAILQRITPALARRQQELWRQIDELVKVLEGASDDARIEQQEAELQRLQVVAGRAAYFAGWAHYYRGLLSRPVQSGDFSAARAVFLRILEIPEEELKANYSELDAEILALQSPWRARTVIGLGLSEAGLKNLAASRACFALLASPVVPPTVRDQAAHWHLQALLNAGHRREAADLARQYLATLELPPTQGKVSFCSTLLRAGLLPWHGHEPQPELVDLATAGFVKLRQHRMLGELLTRFGGSLDNARGFPLLWLRGQQLRRAADESKSADDYRKAAEALRAALADPQAKGDLAGANRCRMELAWCLYQLEDDETAARLYREAAEGLRAAKAEGAVDAGWMVFVTQHRRAVRGEGDPSALRAALEWLRREYPSHAYTKRAEFAAARMALKTAGPEEQRAALESVPPGDPNYVAARQQLCTLLYERWNRAPAAEKAAARKEALEVIQEVLAMSSASTDVRRQVELRLMIVNMALEHHDPQLEVAADQLDAIDRHLPTLESGETVAEYHYRRYQFAQAAGDHEAAWNAARWFVENDEPSRWEVAGLVAAARLIDERYARSAENERRAIAEQAHAVYTRLAERLGDDPAILTTKRNAQVALSKKAHYAYELGRLDEAAHALERLLAALPREKSYLRRAAKVAFEQKDLERSLERWRVLLAGSRPGAEEWYEAKYYQLACLLEIDRDRAAQVFKQFELLDPQLGSAAWRDRFRQLRDQL